MDTPPASSGQTHKPRPDRDRFVAFAFCWADVLFELDAEQKIIFAAGPIEALLGRGMKELIGVPFIDLAARSNKSLVSELMMVAEKQGRIENTSIRLRGSQGDTSRLSFAGYRLNDLDGHYFLALRAAATVKKRPDGRSFSRDTESGLFDAHSFADLANEQLKAAREAGEEAELTLVSLPNIEAFRQNLDEDAQQSLADSFGAALRANSLNGDTAAEIGEGKFALVHESSMDIGVLEDRLAEVTREVDPAGEGITAESATLEVGDGELNDEDFANGLVYAINKFKDSKAGEFNLKDFSTNISSMVDQAVSSVREFKEIIDGEKFDVAFHPILNNKTGKVHHYESLVRFHKLDSGTSPFEYITYAEEVGLIWQFDIAMARKVIRWLDKNRTKGYSIAVNISGNSIGNLTYLADLHALLKKNFWAKGLILFEITESSRIADLSSANRFIQKVRGEGYEVCLDDFGAGAASFQYLASLDVDVVKLDGSAVKNALTSKKGQSFLTALTRLCRDMGVETIAEMIDDKETLNFVRKCGVDYAQGYLFGEPSTDITIFENYTYAQHFTSK